MTKKYTSAPRFLKKILASLADTKITYDALGDYEERYNQLYMNRGRAAAYSWYTFQIVLLLPGFLLTSVRSSSGMVKNYFSIALRNSRRHKLYTALNVFGLSSGLAFCFIIMLFISNELSYDAFHEKANRIYRVTQTVNTNDFSDQTASVPLPVGTILSTEFADVQIVRLYKSIYWESLVTYGDKAFVENRYFRADPSFFRIFDFEFISGNPETALDDPKSVVITEETARKYFGEDDPVGKIITVESRGKTDAKITGVIKNVPRNAHFTFDFLANGNFGSLANRWGGPGLWLYMVLPEGGSATYFEDQFPEIVAQHFPTERRSTVLHLQPLQDIYLYSHLTNEIQQNGNAIYLWILGIVAPVVLLMASINYMNLTTARSMNRAKEVGVRKVSGAVRSQLIFQFLGESLLMSSMSIAAAIGLVAVFLPFFNAMMNTGLQLGALFERNTVLSITGLGTGIGLLSGIYPAMILSSFRPSSILKGGSVRHGSAEMLRKALVTVQFALSITVLISTGVVYKQLVFIKNDTLGIDKEQVLITNISLRMMQDMENREDALKNELASAPGVKAVTTLDILPWKRLETRDFRLQGSPHKGEILLPVVWTDPQYEKLFGLEIIKGKNFSMKKNPDESSREDAWEFLINEKGAEKLGLENPIGTELDINFDEDGWYSGVIVGLVKDFSYKTLHQEIDPLIITGAEGFGFTHFAIKLETSNINVTIEHLEEKWGTFSAGYPFDYFFMDDDYNNLYRSEQKFGNLFNIFSLFSIVIACFGLFGLMSYTIEQRVKEIGIRKVLGASIRNILQVLIQDTLKLLAIAALLAIPVGYFAVNRWLENFAYRVSAGLEVFAFAIFAVLFLSVATVGFQSLKAALSNPVHSLRHE